MAKHDIEDQWSSAEMTENQTTVFDPGNPPSLTIVEAIADQEDVDPAELDFRLYDYIDPEALDTVMESDEVEITFSIGEYEIHVVDSDVIRVLE